MADKKTERLDAIAKYNRLIEKHAGKAVRPFREDGYVNLINRYGTQKDQSEQYKFIPEPEFPDELLTMYYEGNGLFAKIIDTPAEEAVKHGFELDDVKDSELVDFYEEALDELDWEETAMTAIKWARLFGGSIAVMLINDGRGLEEPLDWRHIRSIDDIRVYDRSVIQPDYSSLFLYDPHNPFRTRGSRLGMPEWYDVFSRYGSFRVHESRCLTFRNGILPENTRSTTYQMWGVPEYVRIHRAVRDAEVAHGNAPKLLERSIQAIYKMKDLSLELETEQGEDVLLRRLQAIDMARGMMNSIAIDSDGEDYDFKTFQFTGINDVISAACNLLSAVTNIPQAILFGQPIGGMSSTDDTAMEMFYNFVEHIQKRQLRSNLRYLLSIIFQAGVRTGEVDEVPKLKVKFNPLWSMSDTEKADLEQKKAQTQQTKAQTAQIYVDMQAIDPSEVRKKLADSDEFDVENMLDEYDEEELFPEEQEPQIDPTTGQPIQLAQGGEVSPGTHGTITEQGALAEYGENVDIEKHNTDPGTEGSTSTAAPAATKLPQDMSAEELEKAQNAQENRDSGPKVSKPTAAKTGGVGVICVQNGAMLVSERKEGQGSGLIGGPGGHIEHGETPEQAAYRETEEEFGISPKELTLIGYGPKEPETGYTPAVFLCTKWEGEPHPVDGEMGDAMWLPPKMIEDLRPSLFPPFADGYDLLLRVLADPNSEPMDPDGSLNEDGGPGSGNFGHAGRPGEVGGSASGSFDSSKLNPVQRGEQLTKEKLDKYAAICCADALGANSDSKFRLRTQDGITRANIETEKGELVVNINEGKGDIYLDTIYVGDQRGGTGTELIAKLVANSRESGFKTITAFGAGGNGDSYNGYYTLPRLGFDGDLPENTVRAAKDAGFDASKVSKLMETPEGRSWWKENGHGLYLEFDLSDGSNALRTLESYIASRSDCSDDFSEKTLDKPPQSVTIKSQGQMDAEFSEADHPRDANGQFTSGGGSSSSSKEEKPKAPKPTSFKRNGNKMTVSKNTRIKIGKNGGKTVMLSGELDGVEDFAGTPNTKALEKEPEIISVYGGKAGEWKHTLGFGSIRRSDGTVQRAEIHWFEHDSIGQVGWKVKKFVKE